MTHTKVPGTFSGGGSKAAASERFLTPFLLLGVIAGAAVLRLGRLDNRPMHCDEANQAVRFGGLLERGEYDYNPREHHGPSLYYLSWPIARAAGARNLTEVTEFQLRLLPAIFGIVLVGLVWLLRAELGEAAAFWAAVLTALSPAMVFYSRYYIQEMLLACFTFGAIVALWRYARHIAFLSGVRGQESGIGNHPLTPSRTVWLVLLGLSLGMMHASKETCVIALFAMAVAAVLAMDHLRRAPWKRLLPAGLIVLAVAAGSSALLYSSFLDDSEDVAESYTTYGHYFNRASGEGTAGPHDQPWHHYFQRLFWWQRDGGPLWTEAAIAALALVAAVAAVMGKAIGPTGLPLARFLVIYTVLMTAIYSAIPYKTPWCALGLLHGMILLAGIGAAVLVRLAPHWTLKGVVILAIGAAAAHLGWQAHRASFVAFADPTNPYVYAHTTVDVPRLAERIQEIAAVHGDGMAMRVQVISVDSDVWPLPWYLRRLPNARYCQGIPGSLPAPLIVTQPVIADEVLNYAYTRPPPGERPLFDQLLPKQADRDWRLRPGVSLHVYLHRDLLIAAQRAEQGPLQP